MQDTGNRLKSATSPYLLQHANNPVNWFPWGEEAFEKAKKEDKPIILSIGYSSCHWCHVMERESFENDSIAEVMNKYFVSIKVDREERPDVDQIYMDAVQAMGMNGGWPLNVFLTPDLKPFYGGTYFPPQQWHQILERINSVFTERRDEISKSADQLTTALASSEIHKYNLALSESAYDIQLAQNSINKMSMRFDSIYGGTDRAPKFPMPSMWQYLLRYSVINDDTTALKHLELTLKKMASGGIFDQAGGGFARYSTDKEWKVPHFEKMLYDNGQLLALYAEAYNATDNTFFKDILTRTKIWLDREMLDETGGYYSALDADSEGEEGKFYVFTIEEIEEAINEEHVTLAKDYYNISVEGNWEEGKNILHATKTPEDYARENSLDVDELKESLSRINEQLLEYRSSRVRPGLDDKIITSWNAMVIVGFTEAYKATGDREYLESALRTYQFIDTHMIQNDKLKRTFNKGEARIDAYLEDYAHYIQALIKLYEITFDEKFIREADKWTKQVINEFYDDNEGMFFYTASETKNLIARKKEIFDNVIPSSNSVMAQNLFFLSHYVDNPEYQEMADKMVRRVSDLLVQATMDLANWGSLYLFFTKPTAEIVIIGEQNQKMREELEKHYLPNKVILGAKDEGELPLLANRTTRNGESMIYVCYNKTCKLPVNSVDKALQQLQ